MILLLTSQHYINIIINLILALQLYIKRSYTVLHLCCYKTIKSAINMMGRFQLSASRRYTVHPQNRVLTWPSKTTDKSSYVVVRAEIELGAS